MTVGERIKQHRIKSNMTLLEVAEQLGVQEATVQRYESGSIKNISIETIEKLAAIFKISPAELTGWVEEKKRITDEEFIKIYESLPYEKKQVMYHLIHFLYWTNKVEEMENRKIIDRIVLANIAI